MQSWSCTSQDLTLSIDATGGGGGGGGGSARVWVRSVVIAHGGSTDTIGESALEADSREEKKKKRRKKSNAALGTRTRVSIAPGFLVGRSTNSYPRSSTSQSGRVV